MHDFPIVRDLAITFGLAFVAMLICLRLRLPGLIGLLLTGVICGPQGLGLITAVHEVETLAEIGIALLLFGIGIELSLRRFMSTFWQILSGGGLQVLVTCCFGFGFAYLLSRPPGEALFLGCLLSLSSTAIVLRLLQERDEIATPHGQFALSILIFQDLIVVPMMLIVPLLAGQHVETSLSLLIVVVESIGILIGTLVAGYWIVPRILHAVAKTRSDQLFLLTVLFCCASVAWVTAQLGLSLALGAFLAGLIISDSEYHHHVLGHVFPFQEVFTSFFFVSTGMLLDVGFVLQYWWLIVICMLGISLLKTTLISGIVLILGYPLRTALLTGLILCQVGEFSFLLIRTGIDYGLADAWYYKLFLSSTLFTMAITPFVIRHATPLADLLQRLPWPDRLAKGGRETAIQRGERRQNHVVIAGFGIAGRNLAHSLKIVGIPYTIIELDSKKVHRYQLAGEPISFGDASQPLLLRHAHIDSATAIAVLINDKSAAHRIVAAAHAINPALYIIARTRNVHEIDTLTSMGANDVVPEDFETSVEIFTRVLRKYLVPKREIDELSAQLRADRYQMLRAPTRERSQLSDLKHHLSSMEIETLRIQSGSQLEGVSLAESGLRAKHQVTVLLIQRDGENLWQLDPAMQFVGGDVVVLFGVPERLATVAELFD